MKENFETINALIVAGQLSLARERFFRQMRISPPGGNRLLFARVARRLHLPMTALRILHPLMNRSFGEPKAPPSVTAEYAASLTLVGACQESERLLRTVPSTEFPESLLFIAFNYVAQWDYAKAIPFLKKYLAKSGMPIYQKMVAEVNLIAALVYERDVSCQSLIDSLIKQARENGFHRLVGNLLLQKGELAVWSKNWKESFVAFSEALEVIPGESSIDRLLVEKWLVIASLYCAPDRLPINLRELSGIRQKAQRLEHWETIRSCDFHQAVMTRDVGLARKVYFGTPYTSLKERLAAEFSGDLKTSSFFEWSTSEHTHNNKAVLRFLEKGLARWPFRYGQLGHRFMLALSHDFYRPCKLAEAHAALFPGEAFNPISSPARLRKITQRVRKSLVSAKLPFSVESRKGMLALQIEPGVALEVPLNRSVLTFADRLRLSAFGSKIFTVGDVTEISGMSYSKTARQIRAAWEAGEMERIGFGKYSMYKLTNKKSA